MLWNLLRALIVIEAVAICGICWRVWQVYFARFRLAHKLGSADRRKRRRGKGLGPERAPWLGLLPAHVALLALGVPAMALALAMLAVARVDHPPIFSGAGLVLAVAGMGIVIGGLRQILGYEDLLIQRR